MKTTFALVGAYAALASAFTPGRHLHFPRSNGTTTTAAPSPQGPLTTLTVKETRTSTIISCSSTVTNCPAGSGITAVPESDRETKIVTQTHKSDSSLLPGKTKVPVQTTDIVITKTITLTKGTGDNKTLVPSVITSTIKSTISPPAAGSKPSDATVTTTATSTSTKTVTITRAKATPTGTSPANGNGGDNGNEKCVSGAAPATVTVTVAQTTVTASASTVTVTASCEASAAPGDSKKKVDNKPGDNKPVNNGIKPVDNGSKPSKPADAEATPCETDGTTTIEATVTVVPYPANNSTIVTATGAPGPSGFARLRR
ncbi:uncharacterized protein BBA_08283 [Beauveria bassiana ARSEF 2860]|uniref:Lustrin A n=1 Tax=Beauveria bassiana (strain ARSEF 2860) TaxID=655819 RepID=J5J8W4_BEAB2|nr:uncharacterized protein BBA_08283 [Beauveria bassiana ARSEF 2860]EJP62738.1 hypothetical protein BBA_08283 [Beauveria bassiana ARSEF 2860]